MKSIRKAQIITGLCRQIPVKKEGVSTHLSTSATTSATRQTGRNEGRVTRSEGRIEDLKEESLTELETPVNSAFLYILLIPWFFLGNPHVASALGAETFRKVKLTLAQFYWTFVVLCWDCFYLLVSKHLTSLSNCLVMSFRMVMLVIVCISMFYVKCDRSSRSKYWRNVHFTVFLLTS